MPRELDHRPETTEMWIRDGRTAVAEVSGSGVVEVTIELLRELMLEAGYTPKEAD